ncbi:MAG TPA: hypothetical protein VM290_05300 [Gaiellaceae bacterium]|nr:hypothetical protein [Gaiellaceae bacterium]
MDGSGELERQPQRGGGAGRWWWWVLVALIALLVVFLFVRGAGGDEPREEPGAEVTTPSLEPVDADELAETESLTIGGEPGEPLLERGPLGEHVGGEVLGTNVLVDSVIAEGVFWVGEGRAQLLLVAPEGEAPPIAPGDRVTFRGTLRALDDETRDAIFGAEAERTVESQGAFVDVSEIAPVGS